MYISMAPNYSKVKSDNNKDQVVHNSYIYNADGSGSVSTYWRCVNRSGCKGRGKIEHGTETFVVTKDHTHAPVQEKVERKRTMECLKAAVTANPLQPIQVQSFLDFLIIEYMYGVVAFAGHILRGP